MLIIYHLHRLCLQAESVILEPNDFYKFFMELLPRSYVFGRKFQLYGYVRSATAQTELTVKTIVISPTTRGFNKVDSDISFQRLRRRWSAGLLVSAALAILTGTSGLVLAGASLLRFIPGSSGLALVGTILLVVTFPLLIFQAHCLDKIEDANRAQRMANYKRRVLGGSEAAKPDRDF